MTIHCMEDEKNNKPYYIPDRIEFGIGLDLYLMGE